LKEKDILSRLRSGDGEAMNELMNQYARLLWPIASAVLQKVGSEQDVEECVADAFIQLWEHPEKFQPEKGKLKSYLCILVRSRAIDRYRSLRLRETIPLETEVFDELAGLQENLIRQETRKELYTAVQALEEPGREILVRRYYYGQKPRQIALALGLTVKQVDNSLYRSKQILRKKLQEEKP